MKLISAIFATALVMATSVITAPIAETSLPSPNISVIGITSPVISNESATPTADAMSGAIANANITITRKDTQTQISGSQRTMVGTAISLPVATMVTIILM